MSGGHSAGGGHVPSSGGHASGGHGHGAHATSAGAHGSTEIPAAPATRFISPARADFEQPFAGRLLLWPVVWTVVAVIFGVLAQRNAGPVDLESAHRHGGSHDVTPAPGHVPAGH